MSSSFNSSFVHFRNEQLVINKLLFSFLSILFIFQLTFEMTKIDKVENNFPYKISNCTIWRFWFMFVLFLIICNKNKENAVKCFWFHVSFTTWNFTSLDIYTLKLNWDTSLFFLFFLVHSKCCYWFHRKLVSICLSVLIKFEFCLSFQFRCFSFIFHVFFFCLFVWIMQFFFTKSI